MSGKRRAAGPASKTSASGAKPKRTLTRKQKVLRVTKWLSLVGLVMVLLGVGAFVVLYRAIDIPDPNEDFEAETSFVYYADGKEEVGSFATQNRESISIKKMPQTLQDAVVAAENRSFWTDKGIDPRGILRAAFSNAKGNSTQGASTITQQYVKILYLNQERSYTRKVKEAILSLKVQRTKSKTEILQGYLNTIYFGRGAYGVQAASQAFFDKDAEDLTLKESAVLASVLNNPTNFDPANGKDNKRALKKRYVYVLEGMADAGNITAEEAAKAEKSLPKFPEIKAESRLGGQRGHMLAMVRDEMHRLGFEDEEIDGAGLRITTTFTKKAMAAAAEGQQEIRPDMGPKGNKELHVAVASVEPGTGAVRGFYGGQDYLDSQINWAVTGGQPGSTFKAFAVAAALQEGFSLEDTFEGNSPYYYNGEGTGSRVRNEGSGPDGLGNDYGESVSLLTATEESINTAFADLTMSVPDGADRILQTARNVGIPAWDKSKTGYDNLHNSPGLEPISGIALGSATISPINMANGYATIANGGEAAKVHVIDKVMSRTGEVLYRFKQHTEQALDDFADGVDVTTETGEKATGEDVAADTSYALQQVVASGTGAAAQALGRPAAGKTGTATAIKGDTDVVSSSWFVGYTPQLATAVMYVRGTGQGQLDGWLPDYGGQLGYFGANYPTRTWTAVMAKALEGTDVENFPEAAHVDGEAPADGHEPYTPPPKPTKTPKPSETPSETPSESATPSETPTPTETPTQSPTDCGVLGCPPSESPTQSPSPSTPPGGGASQGVGRGEHGRRGRRRVRIG